MADLIKAAKDVFIYAFPLIVTEATHRGSDDKGFEHFRTFPTDSEKRVVKLNNDTLYSFAWTQLANTPYLVHIPKITERYYLFPILDAYTNVVESIGTRTPEHAEGDYILLYQDTAVPEGYENYIPIRLKDSLNTILLRIETRGKADYELVNKLQDSITIKPLYPEQVEPIDSSNGISPVKYSETVSTEEFFTLFAKLVKVNPIRDENIIKAFESLGYDKSTGEFSYVSLTEEQKAALEKGREIAFNEIKKAKRIEKNIVRNNGWLSIIGGVGTYGDDYVQRASTAYSGWGANIVQDSAYAVAFTDSDWNVLSNENTYRLHIEKDGYPHAAVFWSITLYGEPSKYPVSNKIDRFAINTYDVESGTVEKNEDGSLDIYISKNEPTDEHKRKNWLPAPTEEKNYSVSIRIYYPDELTIEGKWTPPTVTKI